jgi:transcriptional regulator with XRE-family HTH domain
MVGMTQQQLGDRVGIKFQQIQKYETGANRISASRLWDIATALDAPVDFFFEGMPSGVDAARRNSPVGDAATEAGVERRGRVDYMEDREAVELLRSYYAIPDAQRRRLFDLARVLSDAA